MSTPPLPYERKANFVSYEGPNPTKPKRGTDLDAEFDDIERVLSGVQARAAEIQRDDGKLANGAVHMESLDPVMVGLLTTLDGAPRGPWSPHTDYQARDVVEFSGMGFMAVTPHTSSGDFDADRDAGLWVPVAGDVDIRSDLADPTGGGALVAFRQSGAGASVRTVDQKLNELVTPEDYGAVGDGDADDTAALQRAFDAGGKLRFRNGAVYKISSTLHITQDGTHIEGNGAAIVLPEPGSPPNMISADGRQGFSIVGLVLDGVRGNKGGGDTSGGRGIRLHGCRNFRVSDNIIREIYRTAIWIGSGEFETVYSRDFIVSGNIIHDVGHDARGDGVWIFGHCSRFVISNNVISDARHVGIHVDDVSDSAQPGRECTDFVISGNQVRCDFPGMLEDYGIRVDASYNWVVANNDVRGYPSAFRAWCSQAENHTRRSVLTGNLFIGDKRTVFLQDRADDVLVSGNQIHLIDGPEAEAAVFIVTYQFPSETHKRITVSGNHVCSVASGVKVHSNRSDRMKDVMISGNQVVYTGSSAPSGFDKVGIDLSVLEDGVVSGNVVRGFWIGVYARSSNDNIVIRDNTLLDNINRGIENAAEGALIVRNVTRGNGVSGLRTVDANVASTIIKDNEFLDTTPTSGVLSNTTRKNNIGVADNP